MSGNTESNKRIAKNTAFLYVRMLIVLLINLYITRAVLKNLGVVDYGIYNVVAGFVSMFAFLNTSMNIGVQRFYNFERGRNSNNSQKAVFNAALIIQFFIGIVTLLLLESFGIWYVNTVMIVPTGRIFATNCVFQFSVLSLFLLIIQIPYSAAIMANERMDYYAIVGIIDVLLKLAIVIAIPFVPVDSLILYGTLVASISIVDFLCYFVYVKKLFTELIVDFKSGKPLLRSMFCFSVWNLFDMFAFTMKGQGLNVLLNGFFGPVVNAARGVASQIMNAIQGFSVNIVTAFRPQVVESYAQGDMQRTRSLMYSMSKISFALLYVLSLPVFLELDYILDIWLDGNVPEYTSAFTKLVLFDMLINSLNTPLSQVIQAVGKLRTYQIVRSAVVLTILPVSWISLKIGANPTMVFIVSVIVSIVNQPISMYLLKRVFDYSYWRYTKEVIFPCVNLMVLSLPLPLLIKYFVPSSFLRFLLVGFLCVVLCSALSYCVMITEEQRIQIVAFIRNKLKIAKQ